MKERVFNVEYRIRPLESIKTDEGCERYKEILERYMKEYTLFKEDEEKVTNLMKSRINSLEKDSKERVSLENRISLIEEKRYASSLEGNITAYMLTIAEYEAKLENRSLFDVIKGIITRDDDTKDYLKRRYMKSRAEDSGLSTMEVVDFSLEDPKMAVRKLFEENEYINIPKPEVALVPVDTEVNRIFAEVRDMLDEYLEENGVKKDTEHIDRKPKAVKEILQTSRIFKEAKTSDKDKAPEEIGDEI